MEVMPAVLIAIGVWWNANTVSHLFIHRPFFRRRAANAWFAALLTATLGIPQSLWRDRHLAHHRGVPYRFRVSREIVLQAALVLAIWLVMATQAPAFFAAVYLPGYVLGLLLCAMHGHYEHAGGTTSHYGRLYNALCFNDGYHVEHHRHPSAPWWTLPGFRGQSTRASVWPAPLRWLDEKQLLAGLERLVLRSRLLQRWVLRSHVRAFEHVLANTQPARRVAIVGGGLFPRTALVLRRLAPDAHLTIIDADEDHLSRARSFLQDERIEFIHAHFTNHEIVHSEINLKSRLRSQNPLASCGEACRSASGAEAVELCNLNCELLIVPLSFDGDRSALYSSPPARSVIVHDWIWRRRGRSRIVSLLLLKRVNLVRR
jgi:hypothetical protein